MGNVMSGVGVDLTLWDQHRCPASVPGPPP